MAHSNSKDRVNFSSDNFSGAHPAILKAIAEASQGPEPTYGFDRYTARVREKFKEQFGPDADAYLVFNGTAANVLCLQAMTRPHHAILCATTAHVNEHECGATERFTGCKLVGIPSKDGKLTVEAIEQQLRGIGDQHVSQAKVITITQSTEVGTVYTAAETRALADFAHARGMYLHVDGARIANAAAALGTTLRALTTDAGVDTLSFGATKNGGLGAEAVVLLEPAFQYEFVYIRKQAMQLASKMRYLAVQLECLLTDELWRKNAAHANRMAHLLSSELAHVKGVELVQPTQVNAVFARLPERAVKTLHNEFYFNIWNEHRGTARPELRLMTTFETTEAQVRHFCLRISECVSEALR